MNSASHSRSWAGGRPRAGLRVLLALAAALAAGCAGTPPESEPAPQPPATRGASGDADQDDARALQRRASAPGTRGFSQQGTGSFVDQPPPVPRNWRQGEDGGITLDFQGAELREVINVILGELLQVNYVVDDGVRGQATLHTNRPVQREDLVPILESVLQLNDAALVAAEEGYRIVPMAGAAKQGPAVGVGRRLAGRPGFAVQVLPLRYVPAEAVQPVIEPFIPAGTSLQVNAERNLLVVSGPSRQVQQLVRTVGIFDADWLSGMSFALQPLAKAGAAEVAEEVTQLLESGAGGLSEGMIRLLPIERLNAVLIISRQPEYLQRVRTLVGRFDQSAGGVGRSLHVYYVRHGQSEDLARVLNELFAEGQGLGRAQAAGRGAGQRGGESLGGASPLQSDLNAPPAPPAVAAAAAAAREAAGAQAAPAEASQPSAGAGPVRPAELSTVDIISDPANNALLVMSTDAEFRVLEDALRKLDMPRRQVLVEATIAEVTLTDNLQYGLQWFLDDSIGDTTNQALFSTGGATIPRASVPGFSYSLTNSAGVVRLLFDVLASESKLKILSSPQVLVIDNQTANIRVGDQIPIITRSSSSVGDPDAPVVSEVQFRDTGVLLQVTPHINAGGMVTMEISQEVSEPSADEFAAGNVSILQRSVTSSVAVSSGETVVLGGLIRENKNDTVTGIPFLMNLPVIGKLFSRTVDNTSRTELVVTITPRVITDGAQAREAAWELMQRMRNLKSTDLGRPESDLVGPRDGVSGESQ